jgi:hypothetical protein
LLLVISLKNGEVILLHHDHIILLEHFGRPLIKHLNDVVLHPADHQEFHAEVTDEPLDDGLAGLLVELALEELLVDRQE